MAKRKKDREAQLDELDPIFADGWALLTNVADIHRRYSDRDFADTVPRQLMYYDLGILVTEVVTIKVLLGALGKSAEN